MGWRQGFVEPLMQLGTHLEFVKLPMAAIGINPIRKKNKYQLVFWVSPDKSSRKTAMSEAFGTGERGRISRS